jgi:hypothetical protein
MAEENKKIDPDTMCVGMVWYGMVWCIRTSSTFPENAIIEYSRRIKQYVPFNN